MEIEGWDHSRLYFSGERIYWRLSVCDCGGREWGSAVGVSDHYLLLVGTITRDWDKTLTDLEVIKASELGNVE